MYAKAPIDRSPPLAADAAGLLAFATASACNLPRDADGTLNRVTGGPLRVGVIVHPPWVTDVNGQIGGVEASPGSTDRRRRRERTVSHSANSNASVGREWFWLPFLN